MPYERQGLSDDEIGAELEAQHFDPAQRSRGTLPRVIGGELGFRTRLIGWLNVAAAAWLYEFAALEQGGILQNLGLMTQALGLGGFAHFVAHPFIWMQTLGFRMEELPFSRVIGAGPSMKLLMKVLKKDVPIPTAVGLERDGDVLIKPFCPPYYRTMEDAVLAFIDYKFAGGMGTFRDGGTATAWRDGAAVQAGIPVYSEQAIAATIAYCEYVYTRYGRFPANSGPFRTVLAYQAHHLDLDFYDAFYKPGAYTTTQH